MNDGMEPSAEGFPEDGINSRFERGIGLADLGQGNLRGILLHQRQDEMNTIDHTTQPVAVYSISSVGR